MQSSNQSHWTQLGLVLILLLALGLRLSALGWGQGYFYFGQGDGVEAYTVTVDYAQGEPRAQYIGQPNFNERSKLPGPLWTLFCFAGLRFWGSIEGVMVLSILLNTAAVYLVYLLAERTIGAPGALWAGLLAATLPWAVFYSLGVYNPEVMTFLGAALALALWQVVREDRSPCIFWVALLWLVMPQFHMAGLALLPAIALILVLAPTRLSWSWLAAGTVAGAFFYLPYLQGDGARGWQNTQGMFSGKSMRSWDSLKTLSTPLNMLVNWVPRWERSFAAYRQAGRACFGAFAVLAAVNLVSLAAALGMLGGAFVRAREAMAGCWRSPREAFRRSPAVLFLTILALGPLAFALATGHAFHSRYAMVMLSPLVGLAVCGALQARRWPRWGNYFMAALIVTVCANIWFVPAYYYQQGRRIELGAVFVPSFRKMETVYRALKAHAGENHGVQVDTADYLHGLRPGEVELKDAGLLSRYVQIREREGRLLRSPGDAVVKYRLSRAEEVREPDSQVAFRGNGIALVAAAGQ